MKIEGGRMTDTEDYIVFDRTGTPHVVVAVQTEKGCENKLLPDVRKKVGGGGMTREEAAKNPVDLAIWEFENAIKGAEEDNSEYPNYCIHIDEYKTALKALRNRN